MGAKWRALDTAPGRVNLGKPEKTRYLIPFRRTCAFIHGNCRKTMLRDSIKSAQVAAMKAGDKPRLAAVRLILAKLKDRDIELRTAEKLPEDDALVVEVLQKMAKQRRESIEAFRAGGREERAEAEAAELAVIEEFLPAQMDEAATKATIEAIKAEVGATGIKDMGRVMAELKARHGSVLDMGKASGWVKESLA